MAAQQSLMSMDERKRARARLSIPVQVAGQRLESTPALMMDVSGAGCRLRLVVQISTGTFLTVKVEGFTSYTGWVVWQRGQDVGLDFANPIPVAVVQHLVQLGRGHVTLTPTI
jgi:hypothetical protein